MNVWSRTIGIAVLAVAFSSVLSGCASDPLPDGERIEQENWILDTGFERGAMVFNPIPGSARVNGKLDFGRDLDGLKSDWIVSQWNSKSDLVKIAGKREDDRYVYENEYKTLAVADDGTVTLGVDAGEEYEKPRSSPMDPWLHLYLEQRYKAPKRLAAEQSLRFQVRITESISRMTPEQYDPGLHAAQAVFYLIIGDLSGSGDFLNFCVPIYDNREAIPPGEWHVDSGFNPAGDTHKLIYTMDGKDVYDRPTGDGEWHDVDIKLKPHIERALATAKENGYFDGVDYENLGLNAIYVGWEVPGIFKSEMQIKGMAITGE